MNTEDIVERILNFLETTGTFLVKEGFKITIKQVYIEGIGYLVGAAFFLFLTLLLFFVGRRLRNSEEDEGAFAFAYFGSIIFLGIAIWIGFCGFNILVNPEYFAVLRLINLIK